MAVEELFGECAHRAYAGVLIPDECQGPAGEPRAETVAGVLVVEDGVQHGHRALTVLLLDRVTQDADEIARNPELESLPIRIVHDLGDLLQNRLRRLRRAMPVFAIHGVHNPSSRRGDTTTKFESSAPLRRRTHLCDPGHTIPYGYVGARRRDETTSGQPGYEGDNTAGVPAPANPGMVSGARFVAHSSHNFTTRGLPRSGG